jgi:hypothetical protein
MSLLTFSAQADTTSVCEQTALGKSLSKLEAQSRELIQPTIQDWIQPILEEAKSFNPKNHADLIDMTMHFIAGIQGQLKKLEKNKCISHITALVEKKIASYSSFTGPDQIELDQKIRLIPNPSTYLFNFNEYQKLAEQKLTVEQLTQWETARTKLDQSFGKIKSPIGKLTPSERLLLYYTRPEINQLSYMFMDTLTLMTANSTTVTVSSDVTKREVEIVLSPTDLAHLSIRYFEREIKKLNLTKTFSSKKLDKPDVVMATFYNQEIDSESVLVLLNNKSIREPRNTFLKRLAKLSWSAAKVVMFQIPVTMPFITFGTLLYDAIQAKKEAERNEADAANLIPSP